MKRIFPIVFLLVCLVQWAVPALMIHKREQALAKGEVFLFKTAPVDPYDAFRGRYVALGFDLNSITNSFGYTNEIHHQQMYATLGRDEAGFAAITGLTENAPASASIPVRILYMHEGIIRLELPFDRFYMEEHLAPVAESVYRSASRSDATNTFVIVRVYEHFPVLEDLIINGRPAREYPLEQDD
jgi:uncharacterized membrane-anchored protein